MAPLTTSPTFADAYTDAIPGSRALCERARRLFPDANDGRGLVSACHTDDVVGETLAALGIAVRAMKDEGLA